MKNLSLKFETMQFIAVLGKVPISNTNNSVVRLINYKPTNLSPYNKNIPILYSQARVRQCFVALLNIYMP